MMIKDAIDNNKLVTEIYNNDKLKRYSLFLFGVIIQALAFNIFILPSNMVFGVSGISVILKNLLGINPSFTILLANILLIVASLVYLGKETTSHTVVGAILYPLLVELTTPLASIIDLGETEQVIIALTGAAIYGFGTGLCFRYGYTTGGTDVIKQIISKYMKKSIGQSTIYIEGFIVTAGVFVFGWQSFIYSILSLVIISYITDKVVLGISEYKTFQIITTEEEKIKKFIIEVLHHGVTLIDNHGGFAGRKQKILMCTVPTKEYFVLKEAILRIDKNAFFIVTDTYEVRGGA